MLAYGIALLDDGKEIVLVTVGADASELFTKADLRYYIDCEVLNPSPDIESCVIVRIRSPRLMGASQPVNEPFIDHWLYIAHAFAGELVFPVSII